MDASEKNTAFKIYKSSAGSGKTFTLVKEYLGVVLRYPERYRNVLAITFTNKAAAEMKERILSELRSLAGGNQGPMYDSLIEEFGIGQESIQGHAAQVLALILHDYANFAVSTIDSFTHRLIRSFAKDLDLPSRFDVEMDTEALLGRMIDQLMDEIGRDPYVTEILIRFVEEKLRNESGWNVDRDITGVAKELFSENSKKPISKLQQLEEDKFILFIDFIRKQAEEYPARMRELGEEGEKIMAKAGVRVDDFKGGKRGWATIFRKVQARLGPTDFNKIMEAKSFLTALTTEEWASKAKINLVMPAMEGGLRAHLLLLVDFHEANYDRFVTAWLAFQNIHSMAVLKQVEDLLELHKSQNNLIHISDFQNKISKLLEVEAPDYIYWRLGEKFRHYLLDEFQDTSLLQWVNLRPLLEYIRHDPETDGSLLIVGDSKQAIYRWRGGEVDLLEVVAPYTLDVEPRILGKNFRSKEYIVEFNNNFFGQARELLKSNDILRSIYTDFEQEVREGNEGEGFVQIALLEGDKKDEFQESALERTLETIHGMVAEGYQLRDIAILVRSRGEGSIAAQYLTAEGIRVISSESILLFLEPVVSFIISLFRFLVDGNDAIARAEVLHYFYHYLHQGAELNVAPDTRIRELISDEKPIQAVFEQLPKEFGILRFKLDQLPLYELTEEIVQIFELKEVAPAFLQHFLDVILQFSERMKPDLGEFLKYWDDNKQKFSVVVPEGEQAIEILTVHKSKGLEFPVVIMPFVNWQIQPQNFSSFWAVADDAFEGYPDTYLVPPRKILESSRFKESYSEEINKTILDNLNVLYVAFTRPRERLYVFIPKGKPRKSAEPPLQKDIRTADALIRLILEEPAFDRAEETLYESGFPIPPDPHPAVPGSIQASEFLSERWRH
ncbi:MAG TPA: hypothetical protein ENJ82_12350, partial [Bacteroidetes bacterium]|nr:hypothetical protein [Bacteroidota bacterium]